MEPIWTDLMFKEKKDAEMVAKELEEYIRRYNHATVNDLAGLVGIYLPFGESAQADKLGWTRESFDYYIQPWWPYNNGKCWKLILAAPDDISTNMAYAVYYGPTFKSAISEYIPNKIIFSGPKTIVIWEDGTKTIVSCSENDNYDEYAGFCAALAKKIYGSTSMGKKVMERHKRVDIPKEKTIINPLTLEEYLESFRKFTERLADIYSFKKEN